MNPLAWLYRKGKPVDTEGPADNDTDEIGGKEEFFLLNARKRRRLEAASRKREQRRGQRAYTKQQLRQEQILADLHHQFAIVDGDVPARNEVVWRVRDNIARKVAAGVEADHLRFDREHRQFVTAGRKGTSPRQPYRHNEIESQLRALASEHVVQPSRQQRRAADALSRMDY